jgi:hypothetical protein
VPIPDECIDLAYAWFAFFFGTPGCQPGLAEVMRVLIPGGGFFIVKEAVEEGKRGQGKISLVAAY